VKVWIAAIVETLRLAGAVLLYMVISPGLEKIVPTVPIIGQSLAAILAATGVLFLSWLLLPFSRVHADLVRYDNGVPFSGPELDVECRSHTPAAVTYGVRITHESWGWLSRKVAERICERGIEVTFRVRSNRLTLHSEDLGADDNRFDDGVVIGIERSPSRTSWQYVVVSVDSADMPNSLAVDVDTEILHLDGGKKYDWLMWSTSNIKRAVLMQMKEPSDKPQ